MWTGSEVENLNRTVAPHPNFQIIIIINLAKVMCARPAVPLASVTFN